MGKRISFLLAAVLAFCGSFSGPYVAMAKSIEEKPAVSEEGVPDAGMPDAGDMGQSLSLEEEGAVPEDVEGLLPEEENGRPDAEGGEGEESPEAEEGAAVALAAEGIAQPYRAQGFRELYSQGQLQFPEELQASVEDGAKEGGLLVTASGEQFAAGKCLISPSFSFDGKTVGRVEVDALAPKGVAVSIAVYLDQSPEPIAVIPLGCQKKSGKWNVEGNRTADVLGQHITGSHQVSFQIATESPKPATVLLRSIEFTENSLPVVYFDLDESQGTILGMHQDPAHEAECYGNMTVQVPEGYASEYTDQALSTQTYDLEYIRGRGNSTWDQDKKPYKLKLSKKADLFGMGANKHWVLLANRLDNSMLRNKATYWLGQELGMPYTPKSVFVEVVMNGVYYGVYCLSEQVRVGKSRVDIDDLEDTEETKHATDEPTITGGYLLSMEPYGDEEKKSFVTERENSFLIESPSFEDYENEAQYNYIKNYVQKTEDAIYGENFRGKDGKGYGEWMDVDSAIDYYWIQEVSMNGDAFATTSTYLYKMRNGKLYWGPLWDFDYVAWASSEYEDEWGETYTEFVQNGKSWFSRLFEDEAFAKRLVGRWPLVQEKLQSLCAPGGMLDQYYGQIATACQYDQEKWGMHSFGQEKDLTLEEEKERLKQWILNRTAWIGQNVETLVPTECTVKFLSEGKLCETRKILMGSPIDSLPTPPARKGYVFTGWFVRESDGLSYRIYPGYYVSGSMTARASWVKKGKIQNVEKLYLSEKDVYLPIWEDVYAIKYDIMPFGATIVDIVWQSSNEKIATVDAEGVVQFQKPGTVKITGTCHNGVKASFKLHILGEDEGISEIASLALNKASIKLEPGKWAKLMLKAEPAPCDTRKITWISLDPEIADVTGAGVAIAGKEGTATVLAFDGNTNNFAKCKVTVEKTVQKGDVFTASYLKYKVTKAGKKGGTAICVGIDKAKLKKATASAKARLKKISIPAAAKWKGKSYQVTGIGKKAFQKTGITAVTLGKNIESIGEGAFQGCKKLSAVTVQSQKLRRIGKKAFQGIQKKAVIKVPKKKAKQYGKLLKPATGYQKAMAVRKF